MQLNKHECIHIYHAITDFGFASFLAAVCFFDFGAIELEQRVTSGLQRGGGVRRLGVVAC